MIYWREKERKTQLECVFPAVCPSLNIQSNFLHWIALPKKPTSYPFIDFIHIANKFLVIFPNYEHIIYDGHFRWSIGKPHKLYIVNKPALVRHWNQTNVTHTREKNNCLLTSTAEINSRTSIINQKFTALLSHCPKFPLVLTMKKRSKKPSTSNVTIITYRWTYEVILIREERNIIYKRQQQNTRRKKKRATTNGFQRRKKPCI